MALRDNLLYQLVNEHKIEKSALMASTRETLKETNYFLNHWNQQSNNASFFKTAATRELDQVFLTHSEKKSSNKNDQDLLNGLNHWLSLKNNSNSKRLQLVTSIKDTLTQTMEPERKIFLG